MLKNYISLTIKSTLLVIRVSIVIILMHNKSMLIISHLILQPLLILIILSTLIKVSKLLSVRIK